MTKKKCKRCQILESVIQDIWWMSRRYADGRMTYAPDMYNKAIDRAIKAGMKIESRNPSSEGIYASEYENRIGG